MQVMSNSRNENGEVVFGMNDATGVFATYPGTLGIAAAVKGLSLIHILSMKQVQEWLGHSTFSTTADIYAHLDYKSKQGSACLLYTSRCV